MGVFVTDVRPRWSDMDAYGHVNHARMVTIIEEARIELLLTEAARRGLTSLIRGMVVVKLAVDYLAPLVVDGASVRVELSVRNLRAASLTVDYTVFRGRGDEAVVVARAETMLAPYDVAETRPRRLTEDERDFLAGYLTGTPDGHGV